MKIVITGQVIDTDYIQSISKILAPIKRDNYDYKELIKDYPQLASYSFTIIFNNGIKNIYIHQGSGQVFTSVPKLQEFRDKIYNLWQKELAKLPTFNL